MNDRAGRVSAIGAVQASPAVTPAWRGLPRALRWAFSHPALWVVPLFVLWSAAHLDGFSWDYDEGIHVYIAWLVQQGHPLYAQTFSPYTPGFIIPLAAAFSLLGPSVAVARMLVVVLAAGGVVGVMVAARELAGGAKASLVAQYLSAALLLLTPAFLQWSRAAMSDLPSAAIAALGVGLALVYLRVGKLRFLAAAELVLAYALWVKLISVGAVAAAGLLVLLRLRGHPAALRRVLVLSLVVGLVAALPLMFFDLPGLYEQALYFHVQKRAAFDQTLLDRIQILADFFAANGALSALALLGTLSVSTASAASVTRQARWLAIVWLVATVVSLLFQTPLFANHHPVVLSLPLAALAGAGGAYGLQSFWHALAAVRGRQAKASMPTWVSASVALLCFGLAIAGAGQYASQLPASVSPPFQPAAEEAVSVLDALTGPQELLVSDAQMIAFRAQRQSPPALADTSSARLASGNLTDEQLIAQTQASGANSILFWSGRLEMASTFAGWVAQNYGPVHSSFQAPNAPYRFWMRRPMPEHPLAAQFGAGITLVGYDLNRRSASPLTTTRPLGLTLYFQRNGPINRPYTVFTHLLAPDGRVVAHSDRPPLDGRYPTDRWQPHEWIVDEFTLVPDFALPGGNYSVELGFYAPDTLQRLPVLVSGVPQPGDRLLLGPFTLLPAAAP